MKIKFKRVDDPIWFRVVDACPQDQGIDEFVESLGGKLYSDNPESYIYNGIFFPSEAAYSWFLLKI